MHIKGIVFRKSLMSKALLTIVLFVSSLLFSVNVHGQSAQAEANFAVCRACHTIGGGKLVGPDLKGVTEKMDEAWLIKFIQNSQSLVQAGDPEAVKIFEEYNKIPMPPHNYSDEQVKDILLYIKNGGKVAGAAETVTGVEETHVEKKAIETGGEQLVAEGKREDIRHMSVTFIVMVVIIVIALVDLFITKIIRYKWIHTVLILIALAVISEIVFREAAALGRQQYYQPDQPIWFSHKVHAGQNRIDCEYCHFTADKSMYAGIPPVKVCMNCHSQVKKGKITGKKEIAKIYAALKNNKPIEWIKVHNLPDHVYFNHAQHVKVGKVKCQSCHGPVEKMDQIIQVNTLSMGWCMDCHRTRNIDISNKFYDKYTKLHDKIKNGEIVKATVIDIGGEECSQCHY